MKNVKNQEAEIVGGFNPSEKNTVVKLDHVPK